MRTTLHMILIKTIYLLVVYFMDYRNNFEEDNIIIVYGHHMRNKTMFGELEKFKNEKFFNGNNLMS